VVLKNNNMKFNHYIVLISAFALSQGIASAVGLSGPLPENSIFGEAWYFDTVENVFHVLFGVIGISIGLSKSFLWQKRFGYTLAAVALFAGGASATGPITEGVTILGASLQNPADTLLHLIAGGITLYLTIKAQPPMNSNKKKQK